MGRGLRWKSLSALGALLPADEPFGGVLRSGAVPAKPAKRVVLGRGGALGGKVNKGEELLIFQCGACQLPPHMRNYLFHPVRKWEIDVAWPQFRIGIEIQGGVWGKGGDDNSPGAHGHGSGIMRDMEKHNALLDCGWRVWLFTPQQIKQGLAVQHLEAVIGSCVSNLLSTVI